MAEHPTMRENLQGISDGINDTITGGVHELVRHQEPITRVMGGVYTVFGAYLLAKGEWEVGATFGVMGGFMSSVRFRANPSDFDIAHQPVTVEPEAIIDPEEQARDERLRKYVEELQNAQLRRYLRGDPGLDNRDDL